MRHAANPSSEPCIEQRQPIRRRVPEVHYTGQLFGNTATTEQRAPGYGRTVSWRFVSVVFSWGLENDYVTSNPVKGVRRLKERARTRYVEDWEYTHVYSLGRFSWRI